MCDYVVVVCVMSGVDGAMERRRRGRAAARYSMRHALLERALASLARRWRDRLPSLLDAISARGAA